MLAPYDYLYFDLDERSEPLPFKKIRKSCFRNILLLKKEGARHLGLPLT